MEGPDLPKLKFVFAFTPSLPFLHSPQYAPANIEEPLVLITHSKLHLFCSYFPTVLPNVV